MRFRGLPTVAILTLVSRFLGLARDSGMAVLFGAGPLLDAFSVAFRVPNLARRLFGEGALTAAFLPVFVKTYERDHELGRRVAWRTTGILAGVLSAGVLAAEVVIAFVAQWTGAEASLLLELLAWLLPYVVLVCVAAQLSAVLHGRSRFFWPAMLPIVLNAVWLAALWMAPNSFGDPQDQMRFVCGSVIFAGVLQCVISERAVAAVGVGRTGRAAAEGAVDVAASNAASLEEETARTVRGVWSTMLPALLGLTVAQLNVVVDSVLAWSFSPSSGLHERWHFVDEGTATALYLGQRLLQFPLGVFGVALGTVLFPVLAKHAQANDRDALRHDLTAGLRLALFIGLPATAGLMLLAEPIPRLLFEYGAFDAADTARTASMVVAYGAGVWALIALLIINRAFYAVGDTQTPLHTSLVAVAVNVVLDIGLLVTAGGPGLAAATTIAAIFQVVYAAILLHRRVSTVDSSALRRTAVRTLVATLLMTVAVVLTQSYVRPLGSRLSDVLAPVAIGGVTFLGVAWARRFEELTWLIRKQLPGDDAD